MTDFRVTTIQTVLNWQDPESNKKRIRDLIEKIELRTDLIILPEMFTTGFSMNAKGLAESMDGPSIHWMHDMATRSQATIIGSLIISEKNRFYNRLIWMRPDGTLEYYDKKHLFSMAGEHHHYSAGNKRLTVNIKGWNVCPLICYDLRFPVWSRNQDDYDILIYVANWPDKRSYAWKSLLVARAIENQAYVIGVNRIGIDENGHNYSGDSMVIAPGPKGVLYHMENQEDVMTHILSGDYLSSIRNKLPFLSDKDQFQLV